MTSAYPLATKIAFLPWLHGTPVPSWRLLLSAGVERPQDILARNESVVAEDSAQVQRWFHLRQVMLAQSYPAHRSSKVFLFFSIPTCSTGLMFRFQGRWAGLLGFNSLPHQVALWRSCVASLVSPHWAVCAHLQIVLSSHLEPCPAQSTAALPCQKGPQCLFSQFPMASASTSPAMSVHEHGR